jgi:hypothetical protein
VRQEITVDAKILDAYVGFYLLSEAVVMAVTREGPQLLVQLTGQNPVPVYAQSDTEFFAKAVDAQISFVIDAGKVESLILHQHGHEVVLKRIDAAAAKEIDKRITERLKSQSPGPGTEAALRRLIEGIISGAPDYRDMTPVVAEATRQQLPKLESDIGQSGPVQTIRFLGVGNKGEDVYLVTHERRPWNWRIALDSAGKIWMVWVSPGL